MLVEASARLVEGDLGERSGVDIIQEVAAVLQMLGAVGGARREARIVIERLVVWLEIGAPVLTRVDDPAFFVRRASSVCDREAPAASVPGPTHTPFGQSISD